MNETAADALEGALEQSDAVYLALQPSPRRLSPAGAPTVNAFPMAIRAAVAHANHAALAIEDVSLAMPADREVVVRIVASGMCHTDIGALDHATLPWPAVLGHEGAGIVEVVGREVTRTRVGDHVVLTTASCGSCTQCMAGEPAYCASFMALNMSGGRRSDGTCTHSQHGQPVFAGFLGQSSLATHVVAHERSVVPVSADLPLDLLSPLGCGVQTGAGAVLNTLRPHAGSSIVIFGAGAVGLSALMAADIAGCGVRIIIDKVADRLDLARDLGATHTIDATVSDPIEAVRAIVPGGADFVVEAAGHPDVMQQAIAVAGRRGSIALVGVARGAKVEVDVTTLQSLGITLKGSLMAGEGGDPSDFLPRLIDYWKDGRLPIEKLVKYYRFEEVNDAIDDARAGRAIKPVIRFEQP